MVRGCLDNRACNLQPQALAEVGGRAVECDAGTIVCKAREIWELIQPHLQWIGFIFGAAMAFLRWWDGREAVVYRRANRRLGERGNQLRAACKHTLDLILRPSAGEMPTQPLFVAPPLRDVLARNGWRPFLSISDTLTYASGKLHEAHAILAEKYRTLRQQKSFIVEQRFSAFLLEGAITAARAAEAKVVHERNRKNNEALKFFEAALNVDSKSSDLLALEFKGLQLVKLNRKPEAQQAFQRIEELLAGLLAGATPLAETTRREYELLRIRNGRYRAELHHESGGNRNANGILLPLVSGHRQVHTQLLEGRDLLERAHFHEIHGCVRVRLAIAAGAQDPAAGVAEESITKAQADYNELIGQLDPRNSRWLTRTVRWLLRSDRRDGSAKLRALARAGLGRLQGIEHGEGCPVCAATLPAAP
jgi:tetratricopeptide (TPR) repeat protein